MKARYPGGPRSAEDAAQDVHKALTIALGHAERGHPIGYPNFLPVHLQGRPFIDRRPCSFEPSHQSQGTPNPANSVSKSEEEIS